MSDNYEFTKSSIPQAIDDYSPYIDKQANNYINDINSGVYTNNSLSLVTFDLGQIYNSHTFITLISRDRKGEWEEAMRYGPFLFSYHCGRVAFN